MGGTRPASVGVPAIFFKHLPMRGKLCLLAFNLWNGYIEPGCEQEAAPYDLFACGYAPYLLEGIRLRYPEYCREQTKTKELPPER